MALGPILRSVLSSPLSAAMGGGVGWWPAGSELALEFDNQRGFNSVDRTKTTPDSILTYTNPSAKMVYGSDGVLRYAPHNLFLNSGAPATQNVTLITGFSYTVTVTGSGSLAGSSGASGTASAGSPATFVATGTTGTFTLTGSLTTIQINRSPAHAGYIPTTTAAVYSLPIDHNPTTFAPLGVLIEEQRTNLLTYSEQFDNAAWVPSNSTKAANVAVSPDGTTTADRIVATTASGYVFQAPSLTTGTAYTVSAFMKKNTLDIVGLCFAGAAFPSGGNFAWFDLQNGTISSVESTITATITALPGGWYRCTATKTAGATAAANIRLQAGAGWVTGSADAWFAWGAQLEAGAFATSYIPTTNNPLGVTRLADQVSILTSAFGYSQTEMTIAGQYQQLVATTVSVPRTTLCAASSGNNRLEMRGADSGLGAFAAYGTGVGVASLGPAAGVAANTPTKLAFAAGASGGALYQNGAPAASNPTSASAPNVGTGTFGVGYNPSAGGQLNGHIKRLTYFPTRRSNADLQVLTT